MTPARVVGAVLMLSAACAVAQGTPQWGVAAETGPAVAVRLLGCQVCGDVQNQVQRFTHVYGTPWSLLPADGDRSKVGSGSFTCATACWASCAGVTVTPAAPFGRKTGPARGNAPEGCTSSHGVPSDTCCWFNSASFRSR